MSDNDLYIRFERNTRIHIPPFLAFAALIGIMSILAAAFHLIVEAFQLIIIVAIEFTVFYLLVWAYYRFRALRSGAHVRVGRVCSVAASLTVIYSLVAITVAQYKEQSEIARYAKLHQQTCVEKINDIKNGQQTNVTNYNDCNKYYDQLTKNDICYRQMAKLVSFHAGYEECDLVSARYLDLSWEDNSLSAGDLVRLRRKAILKAGIIPIESDYSRKFL